MHGARYSNFWVSTVYVCDDWIVLVELHKKMYVSELKNK
jgi:hypothetical protein